jgi:RNA-binding protein
VTLALTGKQRRFLRALAHALKPVVQVGQAGLTAPVLAAIDSALETHELIKVKVAGESEVSARESLRESVAEIEEATRSAVAQVIGHVLVVYRPREKEPRIVLPPGKPDANDEEE